MKRLRCTDYQELSAVEPDWYCKRFTTRVLSKFEPLDVVEKDDILIDDEEVPIPRDPAKFSPYFSEPTRKAEAKTLFRRLRELQPSAWTSRMAHSLSHSHLPSSYHSPSSHSHSHSSHSGFSPPDPAGRVISHPEDGKDDI